MNHITTIGLTMSFKLGITNCYLIEQDSRFMLVDTGGSNRRAELERQLIENGCRPGNLKLIVLTHGDFDHTGNAAYLRERFNALVAMHRDDTGMVEMGDMFINRKTKPTLIIRKLLPIFSGFSKAERFTPDILLEDKADLSKYGLDVEVLSIPGHSRGSIGILTANGDLFCGDLFENLKRPALNSIMDDIGEAHTSVEKLKNLGIHTVFPGHGQPFSLDLFEMTSP